MLSNSQAATSGGEVVASGTFPVAPVAGAVCPLCAAPANVGDAFCEMCGAELAGSVTPDNPVSAAASQLGGAPKSDAVNVSLTSACSCGGLFDADGWCNMCGDRRRPARDHFVEAPSSWVGGVCDRGVRHVRNEDAMALASLPTEGSRCFLVVCDGVSTAPDSDRASLAAAQAACRSLVDRSSVAAIPTGRSARVDFWSRELVAAGHVADSEAAAVGAAQPAGVETASATFVAAVFDDSEGGHGSPLIVVAWVGDSRAFWLPDGGEAKQLTVDHSWATAMIEAGEDRALVEADRRAHMITRWIGHDGDHRDAQVVSFDTEGSAGWLVVCSDGLWNYAPSAAEVCSVVETSAASATSGRPVDVAESVVAWVNEQGGHDNVTVAVARVPQTAGVAPSTAS